MDISELGKYRKTTVIPSGEISYVDVPADRTALAGVSAGQGSEPAALFVHGVGANAHLWRNLISLVAGERRCVALDLPLHGQSPAGPGQDFTLAGLASVLEGSARRSA